MNLHYMISKAIMKASPSVLWCYKKKLAFSRNQQKKSRSSRKNYDDSNPFDQFIRSQNIKYCYYKDTHRVLGTTVDLLVLQDFEAITPNLLARTIETVRGGGAVVLLLNKIDSLKQFYTMSMDVHKRFRTDAHADVVGRFNERFLLSLASCESCLVLNDKLQVLPISSKTLVVNPVAASLSPDEAPELTALKDSLRELNPAGPLVKIATTMDQAKAVMTFIDAIEQKSLRTTVSLTAGRGRGKSAALGLAIAAAVSEGYSNIFVTSPTPENLKTLFEFVFKGFDALGLAEHTDYELVQATNPEFGKAIVRVNIFRGHRQTVQYIAPQDADKLGQAELVVIDEAAAIPLPLVRKLLGPYLVFLSSTINGYEGTGRSLSLKLIKQLREQSAGIASVAASSTGTVLNRTLKEVELAAPIRYSSGDQVERWLNALLCLNAVCPTPKAMPHPSRCQLYYVNRDTLFSYHSVSEEFLQRLMGLFVSSHYKNTPNDLQLLSDAPAHHIFALCGPPEDDATLPDIFAAVQISLEGCISHATSTNSFGESGDLIPWTLKQQFLDDSFPTLSGARVVRIATHPEHERMGYGTRALELLTKYYNGEIVCVDEVEEAVETVDDDGLEERVEGGIGALEPRKRLPPLLLDLSQRHAEQLHYFGTAFGLNQQLYNFWSKNGMKIVYLRQVPSDITGEHSCIMLKRMNAPLVPEIPGDWLERYNEDFQARFSNLLPLEFRAFPATLALSLFSSEPRPRPINRDELLLALGEKGLSRLVAYAQQLVDYRLILDLLPALSRWELCGRLSLHATALQRCAFLALALQGKSVEATAKELGVEVNQVLALLNKEVRRISEYCESVLKGEREAEKKNGSAEKEDGEEQLKAVTTTSSPVNKNSEKSTKEGEEQAGSNHDGKVNETTPNNAERTEEQKELLRLLGFGGKDGKNETKRKRKNDNGGNKKGKKVKYKN